MAHRRATPRWNFLKKHARSVSIIGPLIVLATFIAKDAVRDHVKETVDTLSSAESVFAIRNEAQHTYDELRSLSTHIDMIWDTTPGRRRLLASDEKASFANDYTEQRAVDDQIGFTLENAVELVSKMPNPDPGLLKERDDVQKQYTKLRKDEEDFDKMLVDRKVSYDDTFDAFANVGPEGEDVQGAISDFSDLVLARFHEIRDREETLYRRVTWVSYGLYTIGSLITIGGRMWGIDELTGTE